jgi:DNA-binding CsgD family transcriptional regulator
VQQADRWAQLKRELTRFEPGRAFDLMPHLDELRQLFRAQNTLIYNPSCNERGWDLEFSLWAGDAADVRRAAHREHVRGSVADRPQFAAYDPFAVQRAQRNRALTVEHLIALENRASESHRQVWAAIGAGKQDQVRMLLCHGPRLLGWIGAVRDRAFSAADELRLQSLAEGLRARLLAERAAQSVLPHLGLVEGLLEAMPDPALVLSQRGHVEAANAAGLRLIDDDRTELLSSLRDALARGRRHPAFALTRLVTHGCPEYVLALFVESNLAQADQVARACRRWGVAGRRAAVLERVVAGRSNKEIAVALSCAEVTVERHLTSLFRVSGARSRTELLRKVLLPSAGAATKS